MILCSEHTVIASNNQPNQLYKLFLLFNIYNTQAQKGLVSNRSRDAVGLGKLFTPIGHRASVHQAAKLVAALLMVEGVTAGLAESNSSLPLGL